MANKINIDNVSGFNQVRAAGQSEVKKSSNEPVKIPEVQKTGSEDKLEFSNRGTEVGKLVEEVKNTADTRQEKIDALKQQISTGGYNPSSDAIAEAILKDEKI